MTSITVHHLNQSRSQRILWLLEELGAPYEVVYTDVPRMDGSGGVDARNPHPERKVPALVHDGAVITVRNRVVLDDSRGPERYARSTIRLTAPPGPHAWLNRRIFIGTLQVLRPVREAVLIRGHLVD